jgi:uncharacterized membrane protein YciS (DUF1049 family)
VYVPLSLLLSPVAKSSTTAGVPFGVYAIIQNLNVPLQVQPQIFMALALISWGQCKRYSDSWTRLRSSMIAFLCFLLFGGVEALLILTLRPVYLRGVHYPMTIIGVIAAVLLAAGLIPPYFEIAKRRGRVVGINFLFLTVDWFGAFFSCMSLVAQKQFDVLAGVMYIICMSLETGMFACQALWLLTHWKQWREERRAKKEAKKETDAASTVTGDEKTTVGGSAATLATAEEGKVV